MVFLSMYVIAILMVVCMIGLNAQTYAITLLSLSQAMSVCDAFIRPRSALRMLPAALLGLFLFMVAEYGTRSLLRYAVAQAGCAIVPAYYNGESELQGGMVVGVTRKSSYKPGDIVATTWMGHRIFERVLAVGEHAVAQADGIIKVDGKESQVKPLAPNRRFLWRPMSMCEGQALIVPSFLYIAINDAQVNAGSTPPVFNYSRLEGKVRILFPLWKRQAKEQ